jgi:hypothetical protein
VSDEHSHEIAPAGERSHWLDRLAERYTRRQALKAAAAGAALSTLPLLRAAPALAADPNACRQGCLWTSHQTASSAYGSCNFGGSVADLLIVGYAPAAGFGLFQAAAAGLYEKATLTIACGDKVAANQKASDHSCLQPGCPDFNPKGPNGPCEGVHDYCCPCNTVIQGYQPCTYPCDDPTHDCCG